MRISRADRSVLAEWWFTFDRVLLAALLALVAAGLILSLAASPAVAMRKGLPPLHFAERHIAFALIGVVVMLAVSLLDPRRIRRLALALFVAGITAMAAVLAMGDEINGARRWLRIAGFSLQPSEFAKPAFAVLAAWALSESERRPDMPALALALGMLMAFVTLLALQPDIGQTLLVGAVFIALFVMSGRSPAWIIGLAGLGAAGFAAAWTAFPHVRSRVARFLAPVQGDNSQLDRAFQSFAEGGLLGRGPGEGTIKTVLPDAHTDFIFAVVAEEYGALACLAILALFAVVVMRPLSRATRESDGFVRNATVALALLVGLQALINMAVNVGLIPAKGMTLPFISSGGSSTLAVSITCGMLMALTRRRPDPMRLNLPGLAATGAPLQSIESRS